MTAGRIVFTEEQRRRHPDLVVTMRFLEECCGGAEPGERTPIRDLYRAYRASCRAADLPWATRVRFIGQMVRLGVHFLHPHTDVVDRPSSDNVALIDGPARAPFHPDHGRPFRLELYLAERTVRAPHLRCLTGEIGPDYASWAAGHSYPASFSRLARALVELGVKRWRDASGVRGFEGIGLVDAPRPNVAEDIDAWIGERCMVAAEGGVRTLILYPDFVEWAKRRCCWCLSMRAFAQALVARGWVRWRDSETRQRGFAGVRLLDCRVDADSLKARGANG